MNTRFLLLWCTVLCFILSMQVLPVLGEDLPAIQGSVQEVAEDNSYIVVNDEMLMVDEAIMDYMTMEAGDEVELSIEEVDGKKIIRDFNYVE